MDKEKLIIAYMKEFDLDRETAEKRADAAIAKIEELNKPTEEVVNEDEEEIFWDISEVMCCKCFERWIAVRPSDTMLKDIQCPRCSYTGAVIETGQEFYMEGDLADLEDDENEDDES